MRNFIINLHLVVLHVCQRPVLRILSMWSKRDCNYRENLGKKDR